MRWHRESQTATGPNAQRKAGTVDFWGYIKVWEPGHPAAMDNGWIREHRLVVEKAIRRYLLPTEQVDHINTIKDDNRIENLQILSHSEHSKKTIIDRRKRREQIERDLEELAEYRRIYGPLPTKLKLVS